MDTGITLKSIFASSKEDLSQKLSGLSLPKDAQRIQEIVTDFLNELFENDGRFRQNLTESEDHILRASLKLLQAQQGISNEFVKEISKFDNVTERISQIDKKPSSENGVSTNSINATLGAGVGALAGSFIGSWAAVAGAIAGTALVIYLPNIKALIKEPGKDCKESMQSTSKADELIDSSSFCDIIENICDCIDNIIATYRTQVRKFANAYENREQPSLLNSYSLLIEQIANVIQVSKNCDEETPSKLRNAISILEESLENYDLKFINGKIVNA